MNTSQQSNPWECEICGKVVTVIVGRDGKRHCSSCDAKRPENIKDAIICKECGDYDLPMSFEPMKSEMIELGLCSHCHFWTGIYMTKDNPKRIFANGDAYWIRDEDQGSWSAMRGYGGHKFFIKKYLTKNTFTIITTTNLWHNGTVPEHFRSRLPDNAVM